MNFFKWIKELFEDNRKEIIKHFLSQELDYKNEEIFRQIQVLKSLENEREKLKIMVFGN